MANLCCARNKGYCTINVLPLVNGGNEKRVELNVSLLTQFWRCVTVTSTSVDISRVRNKKKKKTFVAHLYLVPESRAGPFFSPSDGQKVPASRSKKFRNTK